MRFISSVIEKSTYREITNEPIEIILLLFFKIKINSEPKNIGIAGCRNISVIIIFLIPLKKICQNFSYSNKH